MRVAHKLFQVLRKRIPRGEGMPGLPVTAPQQEEAAEQQQDSGAHRGHQDAAGHDPGRGGFVNGCLLTDRLTPFSSFVPIKKKPSNLDTVSCL